MQTYLSSLKFLHPVIFKPWLTLVVKDDLKMSDMGLGKKKEMKWVAEQ